MGNYWPLLFAGALVGVFTIIFLIAYLKICRDKSAAGFERTIPDSEIIRRLAKYAKPYTRTFILVLFIMILSISYELSAPIIVGRIERLVVNRFELSTLLYYVLGYAAILIVSLVSTYFQSIILQKTGQKILSGLRTDVFTHIESLSHEQLTQIPVGKLVTRVANDTNAISMMFTNTLVQMFKNIFIVVGVLVAMLLLNYQLTLMVLCFVPFVVLFTVIFRAFARKVYRENKNCTTDINTFLSENLSGIKIIQIFNREDRKMEEFLAKSRASEKARGKMVLVNGIFRPMVYMLYITSVLCLFYLGAKGHLDGTTFLGQAIDGSIIVTFYMYLSRFFDPIQDLAEQFNTLQSAFASAEKIFSVMDLEPIVVDEPDAIELTEIRGEIEFKDVWFSYKPGEWVLKGVSFHIKPSQTVAFVGPTGSGKTTILSLICRNYDIQQGQILIDGIDIRKIKISSLRRHFGQMLQDVFLFAGTIRSNIVLRDESFTDEEIMKVCRYVNADHFINR
ncbi:MAG: ABC transporter ATP-binding protein, partial [Oscillospiraceae bacterium]|nr:ABC transporter ATP-binding protein [Oscillospiraceae bacterium]